MELLAQEIFLLGIFFEFSNIDQVNVEAVCDTNEDNLKKFLSDKNDKNIRGYLSLGEMLEKEKILMVSVTQHQINFIKKLHYKFWIKDTMFFVKSR